MDCPHIPQLNYGEFGQRLRQKIAGQRFPVKGSLELTFRCNLHCQHCYLAHRQQSLPGRGELTLPEIQRILDEVVDEGCLWFLLTGGEPLVRRDFKDVYLYAKRKGLLLTLFTNGTLLTPPLADFLAEWRPLSVEITLYGYTQETYERVTGVPGSHARCMRGIELLLERGIDLKLKTMLMTLNRSELWDMKAYAHSLGVDFRFDPMLNAVLDGSRAPLSLRLPPEEVLEFDLADADKVRQWQDFCNRYDGVRVDPDYLYVCGAGVHLFHIDPYGQLSLCMLSRAQSYDLRQGAFAEGWRDYLREVRYQPPLGDYPCNRCELITLCGQCPGWGQMENNDPQGPVDYLCQVAHLRAKAFGFGALSERANITNIEAMDITGVVR